jgi:hypothetical protein
MDKEQIIQWARETDIDWHKHWNDDESNKLEAFAKLVRDDYSNKHAQLWLKRIDEAVRAEREACAKVCDDIDAEYEGEDVLATWCSKAIRARSQ